MKDLINYMVKVSVDLDNRGNVKTASRLINLAQSKNLTANQVKDMVFNESENFTSREIGGFLKLCNTTVPIGGKNSTPLDASNLMQTLMMEDNWDISMVDNYNSLFNNITQSANSLKQEVEQALTSVQSPQLQESLGEFLKSVDMIVESVNGQRDEMSNALQNAKAFKTWKDRAIQQNANQGVQVNDGVAVDTQANTIKELIKLSSITERINGGGEISQKLISLAKKIKNRESVSSRDFLEVDYLFDKVRGKNLVKKAGLGDLWDKAKGAWQGAKSGFSSPYGPNDGSKFAKDLDWLKRSWDNLVKFFDGYNQDAETLVSEWSSSNEPDKKAKIQELKDQAQYFFDLVKQMQGPNNFSAALSGDKFNLQSEPKDKDQEIINEVSSTSGLDPNSVRTAMKTLSDAGGDIDNIDKAHVDILKAFVSGLKTKLTTASGKRRMVTAAFADLDPVIQAMVQAFASGKISMLQPADLDNLENFFNSYQGVAQTKTPEDLEENLYMSADSILKPLYEDPNVTQFFANVNKPTAITQEQKDAIYKLITELTNWQTKNQVQLKQFWAHPPNVPKHPSSKLTRNTSLKDELAKIQSKDYLYGRPVDLKLLVDNVLNSGKQRNPSVSPQLKKSLIDVATILNEINTTGDIKGFESNKVQILNVLNALKAWQAKNNITAKIRDCFNLKKYSATTSPPAPTGTQPADILKAIGYNTNDVNLRNFINGYYHLVNVDKLINMLEQSLQKSTAMNGGSGGPAPTGGGPAPTTP